MGSKRWLTPHMQALRAASPDYTGCDSIWSSQTRRSIRMNHAGCQGAPLPESQRITLRRAVVGSITGHRTESDGCGNVVSGRVARASRNGGLMAELADDFEDMYDGEAELLRESALRAAGFAGALLAALTVVAVLLFYSAYLQERSCGLSGVAPDAAERCGKLKGVEASSVADEAAAAGRLLLASGASAFALGAALLAYGLSHVPHAIAGRISTAAVLLAKVVLAVAGLLSAWAVVDAALTARSALDLVGAALG